MVVWCGILRWKMIMFFSFLMSLALKALRPWKIIIVINYYAAFPWRRLYLYYCKQSYSIVYRKVLEFIKLYNQLFVLNIFSSSKWKWKSVIFINVSTKPFNSRAKPGESAIQNIMLCLSMDYEYTRHGVTLYTMYVMYYAVRKRLIYFRQCPDIILNCL